MKKPSRIQVVIVIWLIIAVPVCFTFFHYYSLSIADFLSSSLKIETPDELNLPPGLLDNKWKVMGSDGFSILFSPELNIFLKFNSDSPQISSLNQVTFVLRC
jgi:hypothetical protein